MRNDQVGPDASARSPRVAYLVNWYPAPSHSFIRREILALESLGCTILRFSIRTGQVASAGSADAAELERTSVLLSAGLVRSLLVYMWFWLRSPIRSWRALALTVRMGWSSDRGLLRHLAYLVEASTLLRAIEGKVDHLHAHFGTNSAMVAMLCTELGGPPFSFTVHGPDEFERSGSIGLQEKVSRARFVAVISDFGRSQLWRVARFEDWSKVRIVRCGVDAAFLEPPRRQPPETPDLVWVGRLAPEKGIPMLLEACRLLRLRGVEFRLTLVGGGPLESWLRAEIQRLGLSECLVLAGWQSAEQIREHMDRSRGLIVASFAEGLPVVIMEALARERPVVATRIAAIPELVVPGVSGWLVTAGRGDQLADAMAELLRCSVAEIVRMGCAGRARVVVCHDAVREAMQLRRAFRGEPDEQVVSSPTKLPH